MIVKQHINLLTKNNCKPQILYIVKIYFASQDELRAFTEWKENMNNKRFSPETEMEKMSASAIAIQY